MFPDRFAAARENASRIFTTPTVIALAVLIGLLALVAITFRDGAVATETRTTKTVELGATPSLPDPACPQKCAVVASVNGFQRVAPSGSAPFRVPFDGMITRFKLYLGKPKASDRRKLNDRFGSPPQAGIAVLRKVKTPGGQEKFKLLRKSRIEGLSQELGTTATITLAKPLAAKRGNIVALSVPNWAPVYSAGLSAKSNSWRASRQANKCTAQFQNATSPQIKLGSTRVYGCTFRGERLLYTVTLTNAPV